MKSIIFVALLLLAGGCVLAPEGTKDQRDRVATAGQTFDMPIEQRDLPELPSPATWQDVLHRAFLASGELEAAYFEWSAAVSRIDIEAAYPNTNLAPSFSYMFSGEQMKSFDRTTVNVGFDPMANLMWPSKVSQAGKIALEEARAAGEKFAAAKFSLQKKTLDAYYDLVLHEEQIRLAGRRVSLARALVDNAAARLSAGGEQQALIRSQIDLAREENALANMEAEHVGHRAMLNAMLTRPAEAAVVLPDHLPPPRDISLSDDELLAVGTAKNPELAAIAHEVTGRQDALQLAKMAYIPDINPTFGFTGSQMQFAGAMVVLPTTIPKIQASIAAAKAMLRSSQAMARQTHADRAAEFIATLYMLRNADRQSEFLEKSLLPMVRQSLDSARQNYAAGSLEFSDLIESQRMQIELREMIAEARIEREKNLAALEQLAGTDIETLKNKSTTQPSHVVREEHHHE